jgi:hypothetical protein
MFCFQGNIGLIKCVFSPHFSISWNSLKGIRVSYSLNILHNLAVTQSSLNHFFLCTHFINISISMVIIRMLKWYVFFMLMNISHIHVEFHSSFLHFAVYLNVSFLSISFLLNECLWYFYNIKFFNL